MVRMAKVHQFHAARVWHVTNSQRQVTAVFILVRKRSFILKHTPTHRDFPAPGFMLAGCISQESIGAQSLHIERKADRACRLTGEGGGIHLKLTGIEGGTGRGWDFLEQGGETPFHQSNLPVASAAANQLVDHISRLIQHA